METKEVRLPWLRWIVIIFVLFEGVWMLCDGSRALVVGDYVTPSSGQYAGQLGPWSKLLQAAGIEPRSTAMKSIYAGYGFIALVTALCFAFSLRWTQWGMPLVAILGLWYLPWGTVINSLVLIVLFVFRNGVETPPMRNARHE
jgi:hypothetical protein